MRVGVVLLAVLYFAGFVHADEAWARIREKDGVVYERRTIEGSKFYEYRAITTVHVAAVQVLDSIWSELVAPPATHITHRDVIRRSDDEIVIHDYIKTPVVSDREVTLRLERYTQPGFGVRFESRNDLGPPPDPKRVRLPVVRGSWRIEPIEGGSRLVYTCYSEPGGSVPAWMVRGAQQEQIAKDVERQLARLRAAH